MAKNASIASPILMDHTVIPVGFIITIENIFSFLVLYRCTRLNYQIRILSINLCISDLLTGLSLCFPLKFYHFSESCGFKKYVNSFFVTISLLTVTVMDIDRCLAIHFGIKYYIYISKRFLISVCTVCWFISFLITYMVYFDFTGYYGVHCEPIFSTPKNSITICASSFLLLSILSNVIMFIYLVRKIRKRYLYIKDKNVLTRSTGRYTEQGIVIKKLLAITGCFILCATPYIITTFPVLDYSTPFGKKVHTITALTILSNSAINPVLYVWRFREARYQLRRSLCFWNQSYVEKLQLRHNEENASYVINLGPAILPENHILTKSNVLCQTC
ncbi:proto-oncogene Mas-like [Saccostrea echinata]|uniref:proto-oncogene Mas-like n=1 Tax=Saccostrea echinata TaxID=191078 RepID=UPI002A819563|nr:proto-oncogene Mas-like [Saccostrea echinata]